VTAFDKAAWILKSFNHHYFKTNKLNQYRYLHLWYPATSNFEANQWRTGLWAVLAWQVTDHMHNITECIYKFMCCLQITIPLPGFVSGCTSWWKCLSYLLCYSDILCTIKTCIQMASKVNSADWVI
jgi:hypothetical protein